MRGGQSRQTNLPLALVPLRQSIFLASVRFLC